MHNWYYGRPLFEAIEMQTELCVIIATKTVLESVECKWDRTQQLRKIPICNSWPVYDCIGS